MYTDASFGNLNNGGSQGGFAILLEGENEECLVMWKSHKLKRVIKSTFAAETLALVDGAEAAVYLQSMIQELCGYKLAIKCLTDNASLLDAIQSTKACKDRRDLAILREMIERCEISVKWVSTCQPTIK